MGQKTQKISIKVTFKTQKVHENIPETVTKYPKTKMLGKRLTASAKIA